MTSGVPRRGNRLRCPWDMSLETVGMTSRVLLEDSRGETHAPKKLTPRLTWESINPSCGICLFLPLGVGIASADRGICLWRPWE